MRLYLVGFMGAGKTAVGELLAAQLRVPFVDLDAMVEAHAGATVREIFERSGEPGFRALEREALLASRQLGDAVVATGGGTVAQPGLRDEMRDGIVVWLNPPFATITTRIGALGKTERPLFRDEAQAFALYRERLGAYRSADLQIDVRPEEGVQETVARLVLALRSMR